MQVPKWLAAVVAVSLIALSVGATLLFTDRISAHETLPAGCTRAEEHLPGCHPTATRVSANTVAVLAIIVSPLASLLVAVVAVSATRSRQTEQLDAERDRLDRELAHDRVLRDRHEIRQILDALTTSSHRYRDLLKDGLDAGERDGDRIFECVDDMEAESNRLLVRLGFKHPIHDAFVRLLRQMADQLRLVDTLIEEGVDSDDERWGLSVGGSDDAFNLLIEAALPYVQVDIPASPARTRPPGGPGA